MFNGILEFFECLKSLAEAMLLKGNRILGAFLILCYILITLSVIAMVIIWIMIFINSIS